MLTANTIQIVKSTAPILAEHGETLTRHFYRRMFEHNPEVKPFFNPSNQQAGLQQRALAAAICAYAANIDNLGVLGGAVELIAQKHASLKVLPEHYPIVGINLLESIKEVLGDGATPEIIEAWKEAYFFLADILIAREGEIYHAHESHAWTGFQQLKVVRKEKESDIITSFYLESLDGAPLPTHVAGQYLTVRLPSPCGHTTMRNYSLSDTPGESWWRISVKREGQEAGISGFVSNYLHDHVQVGDTLEVGAPCGEFVLDLEGAADKPLVFLAGGVGITPLLSMLQEALKQRPERPIYFVQAARNSKVQAFGKTLKSLAASHSQLTLATFLSEVVGEAEPGVYVGKINAQVLSEVLPRQESLYYVCGPKAFMDAAIGILQAWGVPEKHIRHEFFGPQQAISPGKCPVLHEV